MPWYSLQSFYLTGLSIQENKRKIGFQDGGHFGFPIETMLAIFYLKFTLTLPIKDG